MSSPSPLTVSIVPKRADYTAYSRHVIKPLNLFSYRLIAVVVAVLIGSTLNEILSSIPWVQHHIIYDYSVFYIAFLVALYGVLVTGLTRLLGRNIQLVADNQNFLQPKTVLIDETGIRMRSDLTDSFTVWRGVFRIEKTKTHLLFYIDRIHAYVVPLRDFAAQAEADAFCASAMAFWKAATSAPPAPAPDLVPTC